MRQRTIILGEGTELDEALEAFAADIAAESARSRLFLVFEPDCEPGRCSARAGKIAQALPGAKTAGMTTLGATNDQITMPSTAHCTMLSFDSSDVSIFAFDCNKVTPLRAGQQLLGKLTQLENVAGILFISSSTDLFPSPFIDVVSKDFPEVPIFGAQAGTAEFADDQSLVMADGKLYDRGIVAVVFSGKDLQVRADYNMGFRPLGREFTVTQRSGDGIVAAIDNLPATSLYERYLNVAPDDFFYDNVCSFPLLTVSNNLLIPRVPLGYTEDAELKFSMDVPEDTRVSLAYSKPEYLLHETLMSANAMNRFAPEALLLFACMNRRIFMGDEKADREFTYYAHANGNLCWAYGFGEVFRTWEGGGVLNSSLIAAGLREGAAPEDHRESFVDEDLADQEERLSAHVPLSDRMITFLEATSADLRAMIDNLSLLAQRDTLTGLYNRRYMNELLSYELSRLRDDEKLVLLMYDIDHFKRINDTYGHDVGDVILKDLTGCVEDAIRTNDVLSRWGGEEFLLLFTKADPDLAEMLAERVRQHVEEHDFKPVGHVTISVGVTLGTRADTIETLFKRVDEALYEAKRTGRNRVCMM